MYDFDTIINRKNTHSLKYDGIKERLGIEGDDLLPLWVADLDFETPKPIRDALINRIDEKILGYSGGFEDVYVSITNWYEKRHNFSIDKSWIQFSGTIVNAINRILKTFTEEGDKIIIQPPVFPAFRDAIKNHHREVVENPLVLKNGKYVMDLEDLKKKIDPKVKMFILCSPHNPVGRVWTREELKELTDILVENKILIVSDEAHAELVLKGYKHHFIHSISKEVANQSILCVSTHKTFNMAGLEICNMIIPNEVIRNAYNDAQLKDGINKPNLLGLTALKAGFDHCEQWLDEMIEYVEDNFKFLKETLEKEIPKIKMIKSEGTFLAWLDLRELNLASKDIENSLIGKGKILVNQGYSFGTGGEGFIRVNVACPRSVLEEGVKRLALSLTGEGLR